MDTDDNDTLEYTLGGLDAASFEINATNGQLITKAPLDHETKDTYTVTVTATDSEGLTAEITVAIAVLNDPSDDPRPPTPDPTPVNNAPTFSDGESTTREMVENTGSNINIGSAVAAMDTDDNDTLEYTLGGLDAASFEINATNGQLITKAPLDHETKDTYTVTVTATDQGGLSAEIMVTVTVTDVAEYLLTVPQGFSLIHIPLKVTAVAGVLMSIETVGDLYDALGGAATVNLLITYDATTQQWLSYLGDQSRGKPSDAPVTDTLGILAVMKNAVTVSLAGDPLGVDGSSSMTLHPGLNLVGVPLMDSRLTRVSDLFVLEGVVGNVTVIITWDGVFRVVAQPGDPGDIPITGGQAFILIARQMDTVPLTGDGV